MSSVQFCETKFFLNMFTWAGKSITSSKSIKHYNIVNIVSTHSKSVFVVKFSQILFKFIVGQLIFFWFSHPWAYSDETPVSIEWWKLHSQAYTLLKNPTASEIESFLDWFWSFKYFVDLGSFPVWLIVLPRFKRVGSFFAGNSTVMYRRENAINPPYKSMAYMNIKNWPYYAPEYGLVRML